MLPALAIPVSAVILMLRHFYTRRKETMDIAIFSTEGLLFILRWIHFMAGITWIGILYYFNFVQGSWFQETDPSAKKAAVQKLLPRALWWFRWGAMFTFLSGTLILLIRANAGGLEIFESSWGILILTGTTLGTLMFLNVWMIIWPNQRIVIAAANGADHPNAADCGAKAALASRTNTLFSIPLLFFMGSANHLPMDVGYEFSVTWLFVVLAVVIGALQVNAVIGKTACMTSVKGVICSGFGLTIVLYAIIELMT